MHEESMSDFTISPEFGERIHWNKRGSCGEAGCKDPECCCSLCARPIGVPEDDPRWDEHDEYCHDCDLCRDSVPIILWRGEGNAMRQAQFHVRCFERMVGSSEDQEAMLGATEDIVRRGGQRGIGCLLISQRSAVKSDDKTSDRR